MAGRHGQGDAAGDQGRSGAKAPGLDFPRPLTTVDIVIFTIRQEALQVLLVRRGSGPGEPFPGTFALPGGFVDKTGVVSPYLEQLGSWGSADRDPRGWSATHAYFALIPGSAVEAALAADVQWFPLEGTGVTPKLAFDHAEILQAAVQRLRNKVEYTSLPAYLMPKEFTLPELQRTYEIVLDRALEKSAFRTRMLSADLIEPIAKMRKGPNRPAQLYRLKKTAAPVYFARTFNAPE